MPIKGIGNPEVSPVSDRSEPKQTDQAISIFLRSMFNVQQSEPGTEPGEFQSGHRRTNAVCLTKNTPKLDSASGSSSDRILLTRSGDSFDHSRRPPGALGPIDE